MPTPVTVYVLAFNEEQNLRTVLPTVTWADEVLVVDSFSTDGTAQLCRELGVRRVDVPFQGFGRLRNEALKLVKHDWVVSIDADERSTPEFVAELREKLQAPDRVAYFVPRRNFFLGRPIRFSGWYPDYRQPQVFDRRHFRYREDLVHERFECDGSIGYFKNAIIQHAFPTLEVVLRKTDRYTTLMAERNFQAGRRASVFQLTLNPAGAFLKKYVAQQGFRDGLPGFMVAAFHGWYTYLKYAKLWELQLNGRNRPAGDSAPRA